MPEFYSLDANSSDETVNPTTPRDVDRALNAPVQQVASILATSSVEGVDPEIYVDKASDAMDELSDSPPVNNAVIQRFIAEEAPALQPRGLQGAENLRELADPKHRMGMMMSRMYLPYMNSGRKDELSFFAWMDTMSYFQLVELMKKENVANEATIREFAPALASGVKYMNKATRSRYRVWIDTTANKIMFGASPLDTVKLRFQTVFSGEGWAIWVLSPMGDIYTCKHVKGVFQHSSLMAGNEVKGAGEWKVEDGVVKIISGKSGHYKCDIEYLVAALTTMQASGIQLNAANVLVWKAGVAELVPALQFLTMDAAKRTADYKSIGFGELPFDSKTPTPKMAGAMGGHRTPKT